MKEVSIYIYTKYKGSLSKGSGKYHIIWETIVKDNRGIEVPKTVEHKYAVNNVTKNRLELLALKEAFDHMKERCRIIIYIDSQYITSAVSNGWLDSWEAYGFKKKGKDIKHADLWKEILMNMEKHEVLFLSGNKTEYSNYQEFELKDVIA